jgi:hypothetical protein
MAWPDGCLRERPGSNQDNTWWRRCSTSVGGMTGALPGVALIHEPADAVRFVAVDLIEDRAAQAAPAPPSPTEFGNAEKCFPPAGGAAGDQTGWASKQGGQAAALGNRWQQLTCTPGTRGIWRPGGVFSEQIASTDGFAAQNHGANGVQNGRAVARCSAALAPWPRKGWAFLIPLRLQRATGCGFVPLARHGRRGAPRMLMPVSVNRTVYETHAHASMGGPASTPGPVPAPPPDARLGQSRRQTCYPGAPLSEPSRGVRRR